jgi:uncharacterized protein YkuJ
MSNELGWQSLDDARSDMASAFAEGGEVLLAYNNYQTEISSDIKRLESKLRDNGVKTSVQYDCDEEGEKMIEWKFYKPKNATKGRFRLCFNGTPLLEKPFEVRAYAHPHLASFYRRMISVLQREMGDGKTNIEEE